MSTKTNGRNGQHNRYEFSEGGKHTHDWYDSKTGQMGLMEKMQAQKIKGGWGKLLMKTPEEIGQGA